MNAHEIIMAILVGAGTGSILAVQVAALREWNRKLPLKYRPINYIIGDGFLTGGFEVWGNLTGHVDQARAYALMLCIAGLFVVVMYAIFEYIESQARKARAALRARRQNREAARLRAVLAEVPIGGEGGNA